jgi:hypothetical protein
MNRIFFAAPFAISLAVFACQADITDADGGTRMTTILAPDQTSFATVTPVFEKRCGTLDCHGQPGRPLRIYSGNGLRLPNDAGNIPGSSPTTPDEITANYRAVIGLQPEQMTRVIADEDPPTSLLILSKPLNLESHKGGPVFAPSGDPGANCFITWIQGAVDAPSCASAVSGF